MAVVVAQLVEQSLLSPDIRAQIPTSVKFLYTSCTFNRKDDNKDKEVRNGPYC